MDKELRKKRSRQLRKNMTPAERILWVELRKRRLSGFKFLRQAGKLWFILDFYCAEKLLAVELDGRGHRKGYDDWRDRNLLEYEMIKVIRFKNEEVYQNLPEVLTKIKSYLS